MQRQFVGPHAVVPPALPRGELAQGEEDGAALRGGGGGGGIVVGRVSCRAEMEVRTHIKTRHARTLSSRILVATVVVVVVGGRGVEDGSMTAVGCSMIGGGGGVVCVESAATRTPQSLPMLRHPRVDRSKGKGRTSDGRLRGRGDRSVALCGGSVKSKCVA